MSRFSELVAALAAALFLLPSVGSAQLPQASAAALGMGGNVTASARGFSAVANNPAGLGHPDSPGFSIAIATAGAEVGVGPVRLSDISRWQGSLVPEQVKAEWLDRVAAAEGQSGVAFSGFSPLAVSLGRFGFQLSAVGLVSTRLNADASELLLFGNSGRTGEARNFDLAGSSMEGFALSTAALSYGFPVAERVWVGVTGKYSVGHAPLLAGEVSGTFTADPLEINAQFPALVPATEAGGWDNGSGFGMDVGVLYERRELTLGASIQNVFHTFSWDVEGLSYVPAQAVVDFSGGNTDFDERPAAEAPAALLEALDAFTLRPVYSVGAALRATSSVLLTSDVRLRSSGGLQLGPAFHAGVGAEFTMLTFLPLRSHVAAVSGGFQLGGGAGLHLGPVQLSGDLAWRSGARNDDLMAAFALSFGAR